MSSFLKMVLSLFFFLPMRLFAEIEVSQDVCKVSRCSHHGPAIRFPFRLKDQPHHCGYPGFEISCTEKKQTIVELPYSVKLSVKKINYKSQEIVVHDPDFCLQRQLQNFTLSATPFNFKFHSFYFVKDFIFFNCSSSKTMYKNLFWHIPCSFLPSNPVHAVVSDTDLDQLDLSSCHKIFNVSLPFDILYEGGNYFSFTWSESICGDCERQGKKCRLKSNTSKEPETECVEKPAKGKGATTAEVITLYYVYNSNKLDRENTRKIEKFLEDYKALNPSRYSYVDIKKITNHFKDKLGQGGYGSVYKGKLSNEVLVAVKILNDSKGNGEEFINEVGTMSRIHHVNVVRLVGFCADGVKRALIYEFLPNESLEKFIFPTPVKNHSLGWEKLQDIAMGIAKGIEYLHQARGTMGYIAPEVISRNFGNVSYKSDVYSFGMLLLEMVGGRKNIDVTVENTSQVYFPEWVYTQLDQREEVHIRIEKEGDTKIAKKLTIVGLWCIQWYPIDRPSMKVVVQMLEGTGDNLTMPPNPFASIGPTKTNIKRPKKSLQQELTVVPELD
ncbi:Rust resistance kinase Lr10 [Vitis vinifera]|uniref:Rust resistance kinase Lr10 n=1 Tax=Vitis vinifera TaxID=29760 RepID=A0A438DP31_VITVI|nr:Rust resistance kinase Lr10 [Vitis vinifera]